MQDELLLARLRRCEEILKSHGISPDSSQTLGTDPSHDSEQAENDRTLGSAVPSQHSSPVKQDNNSVPAEPFGALRKDPGKLVGEQGRTKFYENSLYSGLKEEIHASDDILEPSSEDESEATREFANAPHSIEFMLGISPTSAPLVSLHPPSELIYKLWQVFLENINPLTKIIHQPTLQSAIFDAIFNLEKVPKGWKH